MDPQKNSDLAKELIKILSNRVYPSFGSALLKLFINEMELTGKQATILWILRLKGNGEIPKLSMKEVVKNTQKWFPSTQKAYISRSITALVNRGYVKTLQNSEDRRKTEVILAKKGIEPLLKAQGRIEEVIKEFLNSLELSYFQRRKLSKGLDKILQKKFVNKNNKEKRG